MSDAAVEVRKLRHLVAWLAAAVVVAALTVAVVLVVRHHHPAFDKTGCYNTRIAAGDTVSDAEAYCGAKSLG